MRVRVTDELVVEVKRTHIGAVSTLGMEVVDLLAKKLGLTDVSEQRNMFNNDNVLTFRALDDEIAEVVIVDVSKDELLRLIETITEQDYIDCRQLTEHHKCAVITEDELSKALAKYK